jgi:hypothetical protein
MRLGSVLGWLVVVLAMFAANCGSSDDGGLFAAGGSGDASSAGVSGSSAGVLGSGGASGFGGTNGFGGQDASDPDAAGTGGSGAASGGSGGNCDQYCGDSDGDGHGDPTKRPAVCQNLGEEWVTICDDCHDGNPEVFPGTTDCRGVPYLLLDGVTQSFDYDCNGSVMECGEVMKATGSCAVSGIGCSGNGYMQNQPDAGGANSYCGSTRYRVCNRIAAILCTAAMEMREAVRCL